MRDGKITTVSSMTGMHDVLDPTDLSIYRDIAGGLTTANILHGSASFPAGKPRPQTQAWIDQSIGVSRQPPKRRGQSCFLRVCPSQVTACFCPGKEKDAQNKSDPGELYREPAVVVIGFSPHTYRLNHSQLCSIAARAAFGLFNP